MWIGCRAGDHLGYEKGEPIGRELPNARNGGSAKTVQTDHGPVPVGVPRDRNGSFLRNLVLARRRHQIPGRPTTETEPRTLSSCGETPNNRAAPLRAEGKRVPERPRLSVSGNRQTIPRPRPCHRHLIRRCVITKGGMQTGTVYQTELAFVKLHQKGAQHVA